MLTLGGFQDNKMKFCVLSLPQKVFPQQLYSAK